LMNLLIVLYHTPAHAPLRELKLDGAGRSLSPAVLSSLQAARMPRIRLEEPTIPRALLTEWDQAQNRVSKWNDYSGAVKYSQRTGKDRPETGKTVSWSDQPIRPRVFFGNARLLATLLDCGSDRRPEQSIEWAGFRAAWLRL